MHYKWSVKTIVLVSVFIASMLFLVGCGSGVANSGSPASTSQPQPQPQPQAPPNVAGNWLFTLTSANQTLELDGQLAEQNPPMVTPGFQHTGTPFTGLEITPGTSTGITGCSLTPSGQVSGNNINLTLTQTYFGTPSQSSAPATYTFTGTIADDQAHMSGTWTSTLTNDCTFDTNGTWTAQLIPSLTRTWTGTVTLSVPSGYATPGIVVPPSFQSPITAVLTETTSGPNMGEITGTITVGGCSYGPVPITDSWHEGVTVSFSNIPSGGMLLCSAVE